MFGFSKKNKRGGIDHTKHATTSMENIINGITPPPQIVQVNQVMPSAASPPAAACDSGSSSFVPTGALVAENDDEQVQYIRPLSERPKLAEVKVLNDIPIIDWSCTDKALFARQVREACRSGCYQVINYGVSMENMEKTKSEAKDLFWSSTFWNDYNRKDDFPYQELRRSYCEKFNPLGSKMLEVISESLGLEGHDSMLMVQGGYHVAMNYYPPWTEPGFSRGLLQGQTDPNAFTIHLLDQESPAHMQIFRQGRWIDVETHPGALLVTIGDKIEALSKGKYKSARYRMTGRPDKERISLPLGSFCSGEGNATSTPGPSTGKSPAICI